MVLEMVIKNEDFDKLPVYINEILKKYLNLTRLKTVFDIP
jgi:hypothetical protein